MKEGMKMPGFSAEASLYKSNKHFSMVSLPSAGTDGQRVQPQANQFKCVYHCIFGPGGSDGEMINCLDGCFGTR